MNAFLNHFLFEYKCGLRNKTLLLMNYFLPLGFFAIMGLIMPRINPFFLDRMIPAMIFFAILAATLLGLPEPLVNAREKGILRNFKINGVPAISVLVIPVLTTMFHTIITTIIIIFAASWFFGANPLTNWTAFGLIFLLAVFACSGIGVLIGVVSSSSQMTVLWAQLIFLPSMLLSGMMLPFNMLPGTMAKIAHLLPVTHAMNAYRGVVQNKTPDFAVLESVLLLPLTGLITFGLALYFFRWDKQK